MNPPSFILYFRTPTGKLILFGLALAGCISLVIWQKNAAPHQSGGGQAEVATVNTVNAARTEVSREDTGIPVLTLPTPPKPVPVSTSVTSPSRKVPVIPTEIYVADATDSFGPIYAPFGRLIRCQLIITVDSSRITTPIVGLVVEDVWHEGNLIIPAGAEVHGIAQADVSLRRIASQNNWTVVFQDGRELPLSGLALDHAPDPIGNGWAITDGSAGLNGDLITADNLASLKLILARTGVGIARGIIDETVTTSAGFGGTTSFSQRQGGIKSAVGEGLQEGLSAYAQLVAQRIQQDGFFIRVPAGKTFYLYVTQTIDLSKSIIAATKTTTNPKK